MPAPNQADPTTVPAKKKRNFGYGSQANSSAAPTKTGNSAGYSMSAVHPAEPGSPPFDHAPTPTIVSDPPAEPGVHQPVTSADPAAGSLAPAADRVVPSSDNPEPLNRDPETAPPDLDTPTHSTQEKGDDSQSQYQGLGAIINNALGKAGPGTSGFENAVKTISVLAAGLEIVSFGGGQILTVPIRCTVQGSAYSVGGPGMTLSNNVYTFVPTDNSRKTATNDNDSPLYSPPTTQSTLTIAGYTMVPEAAGMVIAGSSILPGGRAVTMSNTPISLFPSGVLIIGRFQLHITCSVHFHLGTHPFIANPRGFVLDGAILSPGGAAQTIDNTLISLGNSRTLAIGSSTIWLPTPPPTPYGVPPITVAGQTFVPNPTAFSIAGTVISAGGPPFILAGTIISLQPSGNLIVGSSKIPLTSLPSPVAMNGLSVEVHSTYAVVDAVTISAGAQGATIEGSLVSLESGGAMLDVGSQRFAMPTGSTSGSAGLVAFAGGQTKGMKVSLMMMLFGFGLSPGGVMISKS